MVGRECEMKRITDRVGGHDLVKDVCLHDFDDRVIDRHQRKLGDEIDALLLRNEVATL